jgi:hypothetical protein
VMAQVIAIGEIVATEVSRTFLEPGLFASL